MSYTVGDQINRALRLLGVLAEGETPSAETSQDALMALNQMIDSWSTENLSVFSSVEQVVTWPAGQATVTLGPTGDLVGVRPVSVSDATFYRTSDGIDHPITLVNEDRYNAIVDKTLTGDPWLLLVNMTMPDVELTVYPVPDRNLEFHIISTRELTQPATLATELAFPPGYLRAFVYNLALEIAPEFGATPSRDIVTTAVGSKRNLKRINNPDDVLQMPDALLASRRGFNIVTGGF